MVGDEGRLQEVLLHRRLVKRQQQMAGLFDRRPRDGAVVELGAEPLGTLDPARLDRTDRPTG